MGLFSLPRIPSFWPSCLLLAALAPLRARGAEEEEEKADWMGVAIAATLIGCVFFQMALIYLVNHYDPDMRRYSYEIINQTIAIFSAVLLFQTFDDLIEHFILKGMPLEWQALIDMCHMLFWFLCLQLVLAWMSGALSRSSKAVDAAAVKLNVKYLSLLLAELTGFAAINAWGSLQQLDFIRKRPLLCLAVVPLSFVGQSLLNLLMLRVRQYVTRLDADREELQPLLKLWEEETEEAENDVMGLVTSFNTTQVVRFVICGSLPEQSGELKAEAVDENAVGADTLKLVFAGLLSISVMVVIYIRIVKPPPEVQSPGARGSRVSRMSFASRGSRGSRCGKMSQKPRKSKLRAWSESIQKSLPTSNDIAAWKDEAALGVKALVSLKSAQYGDKCGGDDDSDSSDDELEDEDEEGEEEEEGSLKERFVEVCIVASSMAFAWCLFFAVQLYLNHSHLMVKEHPMVISVLNALLVSFPCIGSIRILDIIADSDCTDDRADDAVKQIIKAIGILVGFSWERCFDKAVESISDVLPFPHTCRLLLALACVAVVVPAWRNYLLPFTLKNGWQFGFVIDERNDKKWHGVVKQLQQTHRKQLKQHIESGSNGSLKRLNSGVLQEVKALIKLSRKGQTLQEAAAAIAAEKQRSQRMCSIADLPQVGRLGSDGEAEDQYTPLAGDENESVRRENVELKRRIQELEAKSTKLEEVLVQSLQSLREKERTDKTNAEDFRIWNGKLESLLARAAGQAKGLNCRLASHLAQAPDMKPSKTAQASGVLLGSGIPDSPQLSSYR